MTTPTTPGPVIPGSGDPAIALAPLVDADRAIAAAVAKRDKLYAAAIEAGWPYSAITAVTGHSRGWIHTLGKRGRAASDNEPDRKESLMTTSTQGYAERSDDTGTEAASVLRLASGRFELQCLRIMPPRDSCGETEARERLDRFRADDLRILEMMAAAAPGLSHDMLQAARDAIYQAEDGLAEGE